jgi:Flp pilus assembly protein TadB
MNRALLIITAPAVAGVALWGGAVLGYTVGVTLAVLLAAAAMLTFLVWRRRGRAAGS